MNNDARVIIRGSVIGAITWLEDREIGVFQYAPDFLDSGIQFALAKVAGFKKERANKMLDHVIEIVHEWSYYADKADVEVKRIKEIQSHQRTNI